MAWIDTTFLIRQKILGKTSEEPTHIVEAYSKPCPTSKMGLLVKMVNEFQLLNVSGESSNLNVSQDSEQASVVKYPD